MYNRSNVYDEGVAALSKSLSSDDMPVKCDTNISYATTTFTASSENPATTNGNCGSDHPVTATNRDYQNCSELTSEATATVVANEGADIEDTKEHETKSPVAEDTADNRGKEVVTSN